MGNEAPEDIAFYNDMFTAIPLRVEELTIEIGHLTS